MVGVAGIIVDQNKSFHYDASLEDALAAFAFCALVTLVLRQQERHGLAAFASVVGLLYGGAKGLVIGLSHHSVNTASIVLCSICGVLAIGSIAGSLRERRQQKDDDYQLLEEANHARLSAYAILRLLKPYFWPRSLVGRLAVFSTLLFVILSKVCTVVAPLVLASAADAVAARDNNSVQKAIRMSLYYALLTFTGKVMKECQSLAYLNVQKYAFIDLSSDTFSHLHSALSKKMGEVVRMGFAGRTFMKMGEASVRITDGMLAWRGDARTFMKYGVLYIGPSIGEAVAVCVLFYVHFKLWSLSLLVFGAVGAYAILTVKMTLWRKRFRSAMNKSDNAWHDRLTDTLVNFETVKYFTAEQYENEQFSKEIAKYQKSSVSVQASLSALNISQQVILCGCLGGAMALSALAVHKGEASVGGFVAVNVWVINLFAPLNFSGPCIMPSSPRRSILRNLSELLAQKPLVKDGPAEHPALASQTPIGVAFADVKFRYPGVTSRCGSQTSDIRGQGGDVARYRRPHRCRQVDDSPVIIPLL